MRARNYVAIGLPVAAVVALVVIGIRQPSSNGVNTPVTPSELPSASETASAQPEKSTEASELVLWIPTGIIGQHDYWIYIDRRIVAARTGPPPSAVAVTMVEIPDGWEFWDRTGRVLKEVKEENGESWDPQLGPSNLEPALRDKIFTPARFSVSPGAHTVEWATNWSTGQTDFPFAFSQSVTIDAGKDWFFPLPHDFSSFEQPWPRGELCSQIVGMEAPEPASLERIAQKEEAYVSDPIVQAMRPAIVAYDGTSKTAIIDFPARQGGKREFDAKEVHELAAAIEGIYDVPDTPESIQSCERLYPEYAAGYAKYGIFLAHLRTDMKRFDDFAADLQEAK